MRNYKKCPTLIPDKSLTQFPWLLSPVTSVNLSCPGQCWPRPHWEPQTSLAEGLQPGVAVGPETDGGGGSSHYQGGGEGRWGSVRVSGQHGIRRSLHLRQTVCPQWGSQLHLHTKQHQEMCPHFHISTPELEICCVTSILLVSFKHIQRWERERNNPRITVVRARRVRLEHHQTDSL